MQMSLPVPNEAVIQCSPVHEVTPDWETGNDNAFCRDSDSKGTFFGSEPLLTLHEPKIPGSAPDVNKKL
jgi:hypothetical protein